MLDSVLRLQSTTEGLHEKLDDIEAKAKLTCPNSAPLLELCQRLYNVKQRVNDITLSIEYIEKAQEKLQDAIKTYYVPSAEAVHYACNKSGRMHIDKFTVPQLTIPQEVVAPPPRIEKEPEEVKVVEHKTKKSSRKVEKAPHDDYPEYKEIEEDEFIDIDKRDRNGINIDIIRDFHKHVYDHFYGRTPNKILKRSDMSKLGLITKPDTCIGVLKILKRIKLDRSKNIIQCIC